MPTIICTVTNDLTYDQRMHRICGTLAQNGYRVVLLGRQLPHSVPQEAMAFEQHRLCCRFNRGFLFYAEFNLRLWIYLMRAEYDAVCSVDLDTLPAGCLASLLRRKKRLFDAHEYFTEVPEVTNRPVVKFFWSTVARFCLPFYRHAYTVGPALAAIFEKKYKIKFGVVRNAPFAPPGPPMEGGRRALVTLPGLGAQEAHLLNVAPVNPSTTPDLGTHEPKSPANIPGVTQINPPPPLHGGAGGGFLLYQGALNKSRGIEQLLQAMQQLEGLELWLAGEGDLSQHLRKMAADLGINDKVRFLGFVKPNDLKQLTPRAWLGLNVLENNGLSYYYSLPNKFFDYVQAGIPQLTMNFPEYRALNAQHEVALLLDELSADSIVAAIRELQENPASYRHLQAATRAAQQDWNWEKESAVLVQRWEAVFADGG